MKLSLSWIGVVLFLIIIVYFVIYGSHVYETFKDEQMVESFENPTPQPTTDLIITKCPASSTSFIDHNGMTLCCDGIITKGKCNGDIICSLSESKQGIPTCTAWREAYLQQKAAKRCPPSLPKFFESEDGKFSGCTSEKRNKTGTNLLKKVDVAKLESLPNDAINTTEASTWCVLFSDKNRDEGHPKSCSNLKMMNSAICFPKTNTDGLKTLKIHTAGYTLEKGVEHPMYNPATVQCQEPGQIHTCIEDKSLLRYMLATKGKTKDGNPIKSIADLDSQDAFYSCSNFENMHILQNISWDEISNNKKVVSVAKEARGAVETITNNPNTSAAINSFMQMIQQMQKK